MKTLRHLLRPSLAADNGDAVPFIWIGDAYRSVCINPNSTRVYAMLWHDGCRKYYPTIYASFLCAIRLLLQGAAFGIGLRSFPRCALEVLRFKCRSMTDAQENVQALLVELRII